MRIHLRAGLDLAIDCQMECPKPAVVVPGTMTKAMSKHHAPRDGARIAGRAEGVAIIHVVDDETVEASSINVLERDGLIPDEFEEQVRAG